MPTLIGPVSPPLVVPPPLRRSQAKEAHIVVTRKSAKKVRFILSPQVRKCFLSGTALFAQQTLCAAVPHVT
jgi:hypothetical protein